MEAIAEIQEVVEEPPVMDTVLMWVGFEQEATRNRIREEGFESFGDLATMKEKDIRDLAESYGRRTVADGRYIFGLRRTRYLIGLIHWVQDFARVGQVPSLAGIDIVPRSAGYCILSGRRQEGGEGSSRHNQ